LGRPDAVLAYRENVGAHRRNGATHAHCALRLRERHEERHASDDAGSSPAIRLHPDSFLCESRSVRRTDANIRRPRILPGSGNCIGTADPIDTAPPALIDSQML
jgi:hypothetical protein